MLLSQTLILHTYRQSYVGNPTKPLDLTLSNLVTLHLRVCVPFINIFGKVVSQSTLFLAEAFLLTQAWNHSILKRRGIYACMCVCVCGGGGMKF